MTTTIDFTPTTAAPFQFQALLDGNTYTCTVLWNIFGARYYIQIADLQNTVILYRSMVGSPLGYDINLVSGYFASTLVFRAPTQQFEISP